MGGGNFEDQCRAPHCNQWAVCGVAVQGAKTVGAAILGGACGRPRHWCIRWDPRRARRGGFGSYWELLYPVFTTGFLVGSPTEKCFRFV